MKNTWWCHVSATVGQQNWFLFIYLFIFFVTHLLYRVSNFFARHFFRGIAYILLVSFLTLVSRSCFLFCSVSGSPLQGWRGQNCGLHYGFPVMYANPERRGRGSRGGPSHQQEDRLRNLFYGRWKGKQLSLNYCKAEYFYMKMLNSLIG